MFRHDQRNMYTYQQYAQVRYYFFFLKKCYISFAAVTQHISSSSTLYLISSYLIFKVKWFEVVPKFLLAGIGKYK